MCVCHVSDYSGGKTRSRFAAELQPEIEYWLALKDKQQEIGNCEKRDENNDAVEDDPMRFVSCDPEEEKGD